LDSLGKKESKEPEFTIHNCPATMIVQIFNNGVHGIPFYPLPHHLCGHGAKITNVDICCDPCPALEMITPDRSAFDILTTDKQETLKEEILKDIKFEKLTGGTQGNLHKRVYCPDLSAHPLIYDRVNKAIAPFVTWIQAKYPALQFIKLGVVKSCPNCPSQSCSLHKNKLHLDYMHDYTELSTNYRPMSFNIGIDEFNFMYLPHSSLK
jgi:hypothetical protein